MDWTGLFFFPNYCLCPSYITLRCFEISRYFLWCPSCMHWLKLCPLCVSMWATVYVIEKKWTKLCFQLSALHLQRSHCQTTPFESRPPSCKAAVGHASLPLPLQTHPGLPQFCQRSRETFSGVPPPTLPCFLPPYSAVQFPHPATILREGVFELPESEFVMIRSKAKGDAAKNRVVYIRPSREGGQIKQPLWARSDKSRDDDPQSHPRSAAVRETPGVSRAR